MGKTYQTTKDFIDRLNIWKKTDKVISDNNETAEASGDPDHMRMGHNKFSDMTA